MGRGGAIYLSYTALVLLSAVTHTNAGLWDVSIDLSPAPSPEDGPPFSAHASRDRSLLPYQIIGIVASYLGSVLILGTLLLTVGRKARKRAQAMAEQPTEMIKPITNTFDASPKSPHSFKSWNRLRSKKSTASSIKSGASNKIGSPGGASVASFDPNVIQQQKQRQHDDMMRIYGAYYEFEDQKMQQAVSTEEITAASLPGNARSRPDLTVNPNIQRVQQTADVAPRSPLSPTTPRSMRAIYPPSEQYPAGGPMSPSHMAQPQSPLRETRINRASSIGSGRTVGSDKASTPNKLQKSIRGGIRNLKISGPYRGDDDNDDGARTPLSPGTFETAQGAPSPPIGHPADSEITPTTAGTGRSVPYPYAHDARMEEIRDLPHPNPQRVGHSYENQAQSLTDVASTRADPTGLALHTKRSNVSAANTTGTLPFRQYTPTSPFPTTFAGDWNTASPLRSPGGIKSPGIRENIVEVGDRRRFGGPLTAGPATPYSPYTPGVLVTPVTPRLTTKFERKQKQKEQRAIKGVITEEDQVADEKDLWSSGY